MAKNWKNFSPFVGLLANSQDGLKAIKEQFSGYRTGRVLLIRSLIADEKNLAVAFRLVSDWHKDGVTPLDWEINTVSRVLFAKGRRNLAHQLFQNTRSILEQTERGYVYNSSFNLKSKKNLFDWSLRDQTGVDIDIVDEPRSDEQSGKLSRAIKFRFLGNPLQLRNLDQVVRLPQGNYSLELTYSSKDLKTPKPIQVALDCVDTRIKLVQLTLMQGTREPLTEKAQFTVSIEGCEFARLGLSNEFVALSWRNRFEGEISIYDLRILRMVN